MEQAIRRGSRACKPTKAVTLHEAEELAERRRRKTAAAALAGAAA